jgi:hypothetical protein
MWHFKSKQRYFLALFIAPVTVFGLVSVAEAKSHAETQLKFARCVLESIHEFEDGMASPESIFLAARHKCTSQEADLFTDLSEEFDEKFPNVDPKLLTDYVFRMRSEIMQNTLEGVAHVILKTRVIEKKNAPNP